MSDRCDDPKCEACNPRASYVTVALPRTEKTPGQRKAERRRARGKR